MWFRAIRISGCPILFWRFGSEDKTQPVKISPCSLLRYNAEEVSQAEARNKFKTIQPVARKEHPFVGSQARSIGLIMFPAKFEAVNSNGKQGRQTKRLRLPAEPLMNVQTRVTQGQLLFSQTQQQLRITRHSPFYRVLSEASGSCSSMGFLQRLV